MVFVGSVTSPEKFYVAYDKIKYTVTSAIEALDLTTKIFCTSIYSFPKNNHVWYIILKVIYQVTPQVPKSTVKLNNAFSFFTN